MEVSNFDQLIDRYASGQVTEQERIKLEAWLEVVKVEGGEDFVMLPEDEEKLFMRITSAAYNVDHVVSYRPMRHRVRKLFRQPVVRMAATLLIVMTASYFFVGRMYTGEVTKVATVDVEKVMLSDGTLVWLRKGSTIVYNTEEFSSNRRISLQGGALFEVAKDSAHPFTITCGDVFVSVVGTSFYLKTVNNNVELEVLTGKVALSSSQSDLPVLVLPLEKITYGVNGPLQKTPLNSEELSVATEHTEYNMKFSGSEMYQVIARLEKKFNITITVKDSELYGCRITANLTDTSLASSLMLIGELLDFKYAIDGNRVTVSGKGCK